MRCDVATHVALATQPGAVGTEIDTGVRRAYVSAQGWVEIENSSFSYDSARRRGKRTDSKAGRIEELEGSRIVNLTTQLMGQNISYQFLSVGNCNGSSHSTRVLK
jgi:hypothetical protein